MSKAVLVMDMPDSCMGCNFLYCNVESNVDSCQAMEVSRIVDLEEKDKPDWCPLRPIPEKKKEEVPIAYTHFGAYNDGWNACIDAIGGGDGDNR